MKRSGIKVLLAMAFWLLVPAVVAGVHAYAPNISGKVTQNTGAPLPGVWIMWDSYEEGNDDNEINRGNHFRYEQSGGNGGFFFKGWDSEGIVEEGGVALSNLGKKVYEKRIDLDYNDANGSEARQSTSNRYNIFNCNNEVNTFSLKVSPELQGAKVQARWRRDSNNTAWSAWTTDKVTLPKETFTNSHDYEIEFRVTLPKRASIRELEKAPVASQVGTSTKVPVCVNTQLCTEGEQACSGAVPTAEGSHRVALSGVGELQRKLNIGDADEPIWMVECVQRGSVENPTYLCTTGNAVEDQTVFGKNNLAQLQSELGYSARVYMPDGKTPTTSRVTAANRRDVYEWETRMNLNGQKVSSVYMIMYTPAASNQAVSSGAQNSQKQATLDFADACRLVIDPYGRVFDSYTLEPLPDAAVTLLRKNADGSYSVMRPDQAVGALTNPQTTSTGGNFSFYVPSGTYRLEVSKPGYRFPASSLNAKASEFYTDIYRGGDIIQETEPVRRNIPMEPSDLNASVEFAKSNPIEVLHVFQSLDRSRGTYRVHGMVSHPRATVTVYGATMSPDGSRTRSSALGTAEADGDGMFEVEIEISTLRPGEVVGELEAIKREIPREQMRPLSQRLRDVLGFLIPDVDAASRRADRVVIPLDPVLPEVSGYATDASGNTMANAPVAILVPGSNVPASITVADASGYFSIPADRLPSVPFAVRVGEGSGSETITTSSFVARNTGRSGTAYFASAGGVNGNVLGETDVADDISVPRDRASLPALASQGNPDNAIVVIAVILITFILTAAFLLGLHVYQQSKRLRRHAR